MPTSSQVAQLLTASRRGDTRTVDAILASIEQDQRERGLGTGASIIQRLRSEMRPQRTSTPTPGSLRDMADHYNQEEQQEQGGIPEDIAGLLIKDENPRNLDQIYLYPEIKVAVEEFLQEFQEQERLVEAGLGSRNRIIMAGPPGNGKTVLASAIAKRVEMEMYKCDFSQILSCYMGIGPRNLGNIFRYIKSLDRPVCLFMDEADAIITSREMLSGQAAGACAQEYRVMVNTILTGLDEIGNKSLIIAASNFERNLDPAALRRFNLKLWLRPPQSEHIARYVTDYQESHAVNFGLGLSDAVRELIGQPWSKVEEFCLEQHRSTVLGRPCHASTGWIGR